MSESAASSPAAQPSRLRKWGIRFLKTLAVLAVLFAAFHLEENWRGERACRRALADWKAAGHPDYDAVFRNPPAVSPERNLLEAPFFSAWKIKTSEYSDPGTREPDLFGKWLTATTAAHVYGDWTEIRWRNLFQAQGKKPPVLKPEPGLTEARRLIKTIEGDYPEITGIVAAEASHPETVFAVRWPEKSRIANASLAPFREIRNSSIVLALYAGASLSEGDGKVALAASRAALRLCRALDSRPNLISCMIGTVDTKMLPVPVIHSGLKSGLWTEDELAGLETLLGDYRPVASLRRAIEGEAMSGIAIMETLPRTELSKNLNWDEPKQALGMLAFTAVPRGWYCANGVATMGYFGRMISPEVFDAKAVRIEALNKIVTEIQESPTWPTNYIAKWSLSSFARIGESAAATQTKLDCVRLGVALERYRLKNDVFPATLDALVPGFVPEVPKGVRSGGLPVYSKTDDGGYSLIYRAEGYEPSRYGSKPGDDLIWTMPAPASSRVAATDS